MIQIGFYLSQPRTAELEKGSCRGGGLSRISVVFGDPEDSSKWASLVLSVPFVPTNPSRTRKEDTSTHARRVTLMVTDIQLARRLRGEVLTLDGGLGA